MAHILPGSCPEADIYALTNDSLSLGRPITDVVQQLLDSGVHIIQYREKDKHANIMLKECLLVKDMIKAANACFIVNDHVDIAIICDADGVHIGQEDLPIQDVRKLVGKEKIIGVSTHNPNQAKAAIHAGADYIGVGPIYHTKTKKDVCEPVTLTYLDWVATHVEIPFVAIGGIKRHNIQDVVKHGAKSCAIVSEILSAPDIPLRIKELRNLMNQAYA